MSLGLAVTGRVRVARVAPCYLSRLKQWPTVWRHGCYFGWLSRVVLLRQPSPFRRPSCPPDLVFFAGWKKIAEIFCFVTRP
ncbi:hypothetical protein [Sinorhizobium meliloti]|uniref:hypothetical protein n=1 Tax=Rhizobium meliloti TaxID=382 RepID=UPI001F2CE21D|nr:hypothetical protein [Sinorhizobium meliloti]